MSYPTILSTSPGNGATGVVLGSNIIITFDVDINQSTVNSSTFSLMGPGQTGVIEPDGLVEDSPTVYTGREYITGVFTFPDTKTIAFTPSRPLRPGVTYTVILTGSDSSLAINVVKSASGDPLVNTLMFQFTTGTLNVITPPVQNPLPSALTPLLPQDITVIPRPAVNNDLTQQITLYFPDNIDPSSIDAAYSNPALAEDLFGTIHFGTGTQSTELTVSDSTPLDDILVSVDPIVGDPSVVVPPGLTFSVAINGNRLEILVGNWPTPPPDPVQP
jgi:hypothetical protein